MPYLFMKMPTSAVCENFTHALAARNIYSIYFDDPMSFTSLMPGSPHLWPSTCGHLEVYLKFLLHSYLVQFLKSALFF